MYITKLFIFCFQSIIKYMSLWVGKCRIIENHLSRTVYIYFITSALLLYIIATTNWLLIQGNISKK